MSDKPDLEKLRAVAEAGQPSLLHTSLSSSLHPDVRQFYRTFDPPTVLALFDRIGELEQRVKDVAWEYEKQLNRLFKKELYCRAQLEPVTSQKEAWRDAAASAWAACNVCGSHAARNKAKAEIREAEELEKE